MTTPLGKCAPRESFVGSGGALSATQVLVLKVALALALLITLGFHVTAWPLQRLLTRHPTDPNSLFLLLPEDLTPKRHH